MNKFLSLFTTLLLLVNVFIYSFLVFPTSIFGGNDNKITICHATSSSTNPFEKIVVSENAYSGHFENPGTPKSGHENDLMFEGDVDCPSPVVTPTISPSPTTSPYPTPTQTISPSPTNSICKTENAECSVNSSGNECCEGLACIPFNENSGNGKCEQTVTPSVSPTQTPSETPTGTITPSVTVIPSETPSVTPTTTPGLCDNNYSCSECSELSTGDSCYEQKMIYCMQNYDCDFVGVDIQLQCVLNNWNCACPTVFPTSTVTPTPPEKWTICHATSSDVHPYSKITVSTKSDGGHFEENGSPENGHEEDILLEGEADCPSLTVAPSVTPTISPSVTPSVSPSVTPTITPTPVSHVLGLTLNKTNNTSGDIGKGSEVTYEIVVENTGETAFFQVLVKDVLPGGFSYIDGSSKVDGNSIGNPENNNGLLTFNIGDLPSGYKKTLIYKTRAVDETVGGSYYNVAYAVGKYIDPSSGNGGEKTFESTSDDSGVKMGGGVDHSIKVGGEVLGAAVTSILPATGSNSLVILAAIMALIVATKLIENKKFVANLRKIVRYTGTFVLTLFISTFLVSLNSGPVKAVTDAVYLQDLPEYVLTDNFRLSYSAISNSTVKAKFYVRKDGTSEWRQFGGEVEGYSQRVQVESTQINAGDGRYYFKVVINGGSASDETNTYIDKGAPNPVSDYRKEKVAGGFYRLYWRTPDNDDFSRVFIYRSTLKSFTADGTTKVGEIGGNKNTNVTWENVGLDSNLDYYYAVRSIDKAGNASGVAADPETSVVLGTSAKTEYREESVKLIPSEKPEDEGGQEEVLSEEDEFDGPTEEKNIIEKVAQFAKDRTKLTLGIILLIALTVYYVYRNRTSFKVDELKPKEKTK